MNKLARNYILGLMLFAVLSLILGCNRLEESKASQPNIIYILSDDLSYRDLSCYGQEQFRTPHLDALAEQGVRFTQAYAGAPECAPSRGTLLTGMHTGHGPIRVNSSVRGQEYIPDSVITVAELLKDVGYATGFVGKWGVGLLGSEGVPEKQGFDYAFGFYDQGRAHTFFPRYLVENSKKIEYPANYQFDMQKRYKMNAGNGNLNEYDEDGKLILSEYKDQSKAVYAQDEIDKAAFRFLEKTKGKPFFLYYATQLPHGPVIIDDLGEMKEHETLPQRQKEWAAMVKKMDTFVGDLVKYLKETGEYENTIIFFSSDNGYAHCGYMGRGNAPHWADDAYLKNKGPFRGGKFSALEGGIRVPFFVTAPAMFKPQVVSTPVWLIDFYATAAELSGVKETPQTDGNSLLPLLENKAAPEFENRPLYFSKNTEQAIRMGAWKAYRKSPKHDMELYLIEEDIHSDRNVAAYYPEIVSQMKELMNNSHTPHEWYRNPWDTKEYFKAKSEKAAQTGNLFRHVRPNGL